MSQNKIISTTLADLAKYFAPTTTIDELMKEVYREENKRYLCRLINASWSIQMSLDDIPPSWEIPSTPDPRGMEKLASDYIEYRKDKAAGRL